MSLQDYFAFATVRQPYTKDFTAPVTDEVLFDAGALPEPAVYGGPANYPAIGWLRVVGGANVANLVIRNVTQGTTILTIPFDANRQACVDTPIGRWTIDKTTGVSPVGLGDTIGFSVTVTAGTPTIAVTGEVGATR